jgi:hypothetical protein
MHTHQVKSGLPTQLKQMEKATSIHIHYISPADYSLDQQFEGVNEAAQDCGGTNSALLLQCGQHKC